MDLRALEAVSLTDSDGRPHRLGDLWAEKPVIVVFLRHFG
jgi:cytochrome oxidase Cu insertion factor (SCO1/SenC/PrrC family)